MDQKEVIPLSGVTVISLMRGGNTRARITYKMIHEALKTYPVLAPYVARSSIVK